MKPVATSLIGNGRHRLSVLLGAIGICLFAVTAPDAVSQTAAAQHRPAPTVLFMCPHGAAKSVLASAYFQRAAKERGLNVRVESAGTDPDPEVAPAVTNHLTKNGYEVPIAKPRRATAADLTAADVVVSIGCDLNSMPAPRGRVIQWNDVPSPSADFAAADAKIHERVIQLVEELARKQER